MPNLTVFNQVSLDGFIADSRGDMQWAHKQDEEWRTFTAENAKGEAAFLFGRVTYEMMASFWPTPQAIQNLPDVARRMNAEKKFVISRTLKSASWNNTTLLQGDLAAEVRKLKKGEGSNMVIFGSGSIVSQLAQEGLIDEFRIVINPIILGGGKSMFSGVTGRPSLRLTKTRAFKNGNVLLCYVPAA